MPQCHHLGAFNVQLQTIMLVGEIVLVDHVLERLERVESVLSDVPHATAIEPVAVVVGVAVRLDFAGAVVHIVWNALVSGEVAPEPVPVLDPQVDQRLTVRNKILAHDVPPIVGVANPVILAVSVLSWGWGTL